MFAVRPTRRFLKDLKRADKRGKNIDELEAIIDLLQLGRPLPDRHRNHKLCGLFEGHRECHIEPDWLLIYRVAGEDLVLERTGSHADLFE